MNNENHPWISEETLEIVDERRTIKGRILEASCDVHKTTLKEVYKQLDKQVRRAVCKDKREFVTLASQADEAARNYNMRDLYSITNKLVGKHVKSKDGNLNVQDIEIEGRWVEHLSSVLNQPPPQIEANIPTANERLQINCDPPTETEVKNAIKSNSFEGKALHLF